MAGSEHVPPAIPGYAPAGRYVLLDGLRGIAALAVVVHHIALATRNRQVFDGAPLAVDFFFCLSGFVIAHAYHAKLVGGMAWREFAARRLVRLYPMYALGQALGLAGLLVLAGHALTDLTAREIVAATVLNLFYLPYFNLATVHVFAAQVTGAVFPSNNPAWSLFFELLVNGAYATIAGIQRKFLVALVALSALGLAGAAFHYGRAPGWGAYNLAGGLARVGFAFFCGVLIFLTRDRLKRLPAVSPVLLVVLVIAMFAVPRLDAPYLEVYWLVAALVAVPLLVSLGANSAFQGAAANKACEYLGRISYPVYCLHYPLLVLMQVVLPPGTAVGWIFAVAFAGSLAASHLLMVHVDEPFRRWLGTRIRASRLPT